MKISHHRSVHSGVALIVTLLVIVILTVCVTAFMQSMSLERHTSRAYLNVLRAEEAARAALQRAVGKIVSHLHRTDVGGAAYTTWGYYPNTTPDTYYLAITAGHPLDLTPATPWLSSSNTTWLFSDSVTLANPANLQTPATIRADPDKIPPLSVNLNTGKRFRGLPSSLRVPWEEMSRLEKNSTLEIVRFAYWVDDESSRINITKSGNINAPGGGHLRSFGASEKEIPLFNVAGTELADVVTFRRLLLSPSAFLELAPTTAPQGDFQFLTTAFSHGLSVIQNGPEPAIGITPEADFPYRGKRRMNLNYTGHPDGSVPSDARVNRISDWIERGAPAYFERGALNFPDFAGNLDPSVRRDMLKTIAASIIDYVDANNIPTQPNLPPPSDLVTPAPPVYLIRDIPRPAFFGADRCPRINEVQVIFNCNDSTYRANLAVNRTYDSGLYTYTIPVTRRFELWNMDSAEIPAASYKVRMYNQQVISAGAFGFGGQSIPTNTDEVLDLGSLSFGPNEIKVVNVVTTFTSTGPNSLGTTWEEFWKGPDHQTNPPDGANNDDEPRAQYNRACVLFTTKDGVDYWVSSTNYMQAAAGSNISYPGRTSAGPGNAGPSLGNSINDPRMSPLRSFTDGAGVSTTGFQYQRDWANSLPGTAGEANSGGTINNQSGSNNFDYQDLDYWDARPQYNATTPRVLPEAIATVANSRFRSIGELGNVFDPGWSHPRGRRPTIASTGYAYGSGLVSLFRGGANLRIGSPDSRTQWAANSWLLTDLFGVSADASKDADLYLSPQWSGKININVPKTVTANGVTLSNMELLFQLPNLVHTPPSGRGTNFDAAKLAHHIRVERLTKNGGEGVNGYVTDWTRARPFFSIGEISQTGVWADRMLYIPEETISDAPVGAPVDQRLTRTNRSDRARKEIFTRSANLLTTNSTSYRVYAIGQVCCASVSDPNKITVLATVPLETSVSATPTFDAVSGALQNVAVKTLYQVRP